MKSSHIKSFQFNRLLLLLAVVVCMVVNNFNVVMAIANNPTVGQPSLVLIDQQQSGGGRHGPTLNATAIKGYFWDFVKYFGIESSAADVDIQIIDGKFHFIKLDNLFSLWMSSTNNFEISILPYR